MAWVRFNGRDLDTMVDVFRAVDLVDPATRTYSVDLRKVGWCWAGIKQQSTRDLEVAAAIRSAEELKIRVRVAADIREHDIIRPRTGPHAGVNYKVVRVNPLDRRVKDCHAKRDTA